MKTTSERTAENTAVLTIELEPQDQSRIVEHGYRHVAGRVNIPGFRRGKAPRQLVERYVGKETLMQEGLDHELNAILRQAMTDENITPYGQPEVDIESMEPLTLKVTISLFPEVELGEYQDLRVPRETVVVENADIEKEIENVRERFATWEEANDRGVKWGDRVQIEMTDFPTGDPEQAKEPQAIEYDVNAESTRPYPRFADELIGMTVDETREFSHDFGEDEQNTEWAGKDITFRVTLKGIRQKNLPELNDELAQREGRFQTVDELREGVANDLRVRAEQEEARRVEDATLAALAERANVNLPPKMVENQVDAMLEDRLNFYTMFGLPKPSMEQYLTAVGKSEEEVRDEMRPQARERLINSLVLQEYAEKENIEVSDEEIEAEIGRLAERAGKDAGRVRRNYRNPEQRDTLRFRLRQEKALDTLVKRAAPQEAPYEATSPVARMLLGQEQPAQPEEDLVRTESGLVIPGYARGRGEAEQQQPEAAGEQQSEAAEQNTPPDLHPPLETGEATENPQTPPEQ